MFTLELQIYDLFKKQFSEEEAKPVITCLQAKADEK